MKKISVDLPEELYEKLRKLAFDNHVSISEMVRIIIEEK